jgi:hypothetical protein
LQEQNPMTEQEYLDLTIKTTSDMLGILLVERQKGREAKQLTEEDDAKLTLAMLTIADLHKGATLLKRESGDLTLPVSGLVDTTGRPLSEVRI